MKRFSGRVRIGLAALALSTACMDGEMPAGVPQSAAQGRWRPGCYVPGTRVPRDAIQARQGSTSVPRSAPRMATRNWCADSRVGACSA
jgi:hypothetical protein